MNAFTRRGACPALSAPMQTGDGLLVRLNPAASGLPPKALIGLCEAARRHGNGLVEITARGSLQIRGLTASSAAALAGDVDRLGISTRTGLPVETGPLAGLDPDEIAAPSRLAEEIRGRIATAAGLEGLLGPKVSVVVDGGGQSGLGAVSADIRLTAQSEDAWRLAIAGDAAGAVGVGLFSTEAAASAALALLSAIARKGIEARARDLSSADISDAVMQGEDAQRPMLPPSVLPDISPAGGEITRGDAGDWPISPPAGEMSGRTEGGAKEHDRTSTLIGTIPLRDSRIALGIALPFGSAGAETLIAFTEAADALGVTDIRLAPKRTILALCATPDGAALLQARARELGFVVDPADPRLHVSACAGKPACASGHISARALAADIAREHQGLLDGSLDIHVSGCAKGCAHPGPAALTLVGVENGVGLVVGGTARGPVRAYTAGGETAMALAKLAGAVAAGRRPGENAARCVARLGDRLAKAFGT